MYTAGLPVNPPIADESNYYGSFEAEFRNFWTNGSYYCILAGLGLLPDQPLPLLLHKTKSVRRAEQLFARVKQQQRELLQTLPTNFEYLRRLHGHDEAEVGGNGAVLAVDGHRNGRAAAGQAVVAGH